MQRGINTQEDRDLLEYRPIIRYEKKQGSFINNVVIPEEYDIDEEIKNVLLRLPSNTTAEVVAFYDDLNKLTRELEEIGGEISVPIESDISKEIKDESSMDISEGITHKLYEDIFYDENNDDYHKQEILRLWEDYHSDIQGSIAGEYYTEYLSIKEDIDNLMDFWSRCAMKNINNSLVFNQQKISDTMVNLQNYEKIDIDKLLLYKKELSELEEKLRGFMITTLDPNDPENIKFDKLESRYNKIRKEYELILRRYNVICEVGDIIKKKINISGFALQLMSKYIKYTPQNTYQGDFAIVLEEILKGFLDGDFLESLKQLRVLTMYSFNTANENIHKLREKQDATFNNKIKRSMQDFCIKDIAIKVGVCHPLIEQFKEIPDEAPKNVGKIADILVDGIQTAESQYNNNIVQLFGAHKNNAKHQVHRIEDINDKNTIRDFYKIISAMIDHIESENKVPSRSTLRSWIVNILRQQNVNRIYDFGTQKQIQL